MRAYQNYEIVATLLVAAWEAKKFSKGGKNIVIA